MLYNAINSSSKDILCMAKLKRGIWQIIQSLSECMFVRMYS